MGCCVSKVLDQVVFLPPSPPSYDNKSFRVDKFVRSASGNKIPIVLYVNRNILLPPSLKSIIFKGDNSRFPGTTIIYSHGNSEDIGQIHTHMRSISRIVKCNVVSYDYSGYGLATGKCSEMNTYLDIEAVFNYLVDRLKIKPENIILFGRSMGSGPTIHLASRQPNLKGVILLSPLLSIVRTQCSCCVCGSTWQSDMFPNIDKLHLVQCPVHVIHGRQDRVVPVEHGEYIFDHVPRPTSATWLDNADHNRLTLTEEEFCSIIRQFTMRLDVMADLDQVQQHLTSSGTNVDALAKSSNDQLSPDAMKRRRSLGDLEAARAQQREEDDDDEDEDEDEDDDEDDIVGQPMEPIDEQHVQLHAKRHKDAGKQRVPLMEFIAFDPALRHHESLSELERDDQEGAGAVEQKQDEDDTADGRAAQAVVSPKSKSRRHRAKTSAARAKTPKKGTKKPRLKRANSMQGSLSIVSAESTIDIDDEEASAKIETYLQRNIGGSDSNLPGDSTNSRSETQSKDALVANARARPQAEQKTQVDNYDDEDVDDVDDHDDDGNDDGDFVRTKSTVADLPPSKLSTTASSPTGSSLRSRGRRRSSSLGLNDRFISFESRPSDQKKKKDKKKATL